MTHDLSTEAIEILRLLSRGGGVRVAGLTGERFVIWRDQQVIGPVFTKAVAQELEWAGLLTERGRQLSRSKKAREILKAMGVA
jgi:hypothetical protein